MKLKIQLSQYQPAVSAYYYGSSVQDYQYYYEHSTSTSMPGPMYRGCWPSFSILLYIVYQVQVLVQHLSPSTYCTMYSVRRLVSKTSFVWLETQYVWSIVILRCPRSRWIIGYIETADCCCYSTLHKSATATTEDAITHYAPLVKKLVAIICSSIRLCSSFDIRVERMKQAAGGLNTTVIMEDTRHWTLPCP